MKKPIRFVTKGFESTKHFSREEERISGVLDTGGSRWFLAYMEDCFSPPIFAVSGDSWEDAWGWLEEDAAGPKLLGLEPVSAADLRTCYGLKGNTDEELFGAAMDAGLRWIDGGLYDFESVKMDGIEADALVFEGTDEDNEEE